MPSLEDIRNALRAGESLDSPESHLTAARPESKDKYWRTFETEHHWTFQCGKVLIHILTSKIKEIMEEPVSGVPADQIFEELRKTTGVWKPGDWQKAKLLCEEFVATYVPKDHKIFWITVKTLAKRGAIGVARRHPGLRVRVESNGMSYRWHKGKWIEADETDNPDGDPTEFKYVDAVEEIYAVPLRDRHPGLRMVVRHKDPDSFTYYAWENGAWVDVDGSER